MGDIRHIDVLSSDGLRLAVEDAGPRRQSGRRPLLCLAGLTRTKRDFHALRDHFAFHATEPRRVVLLDTRGRGGSQACADPRLYTVQREADDAAQVACALSLDHPVAIGTSRGGILAMVLALTRPGLLAGSVLNDVGPRIAGEGLARLKAQLGDSAVPPTWDAARARVQAAMGGQFTAMSPADWDRYARLTFEDVEGRPARAFDPALLAPLKALPQGLPFIDLTAPFRALVTRPTLILHGANSDLLTPQILADGVAMGARSHTIANEGHAPRLEGAVLLEIERFLAANGF